MSVFGHCAKRKHVIRCHSRARAVVSVIVDVLYVRDAAIAYNAERTYINLHMRTSEHTYTGSESPSRTGFNSALVWLYKH